MTQSELQKQLVLVFERLKDEVPRLSSEVHKLGYKQRNALVTHVYSGYTEHEELNDAREAWNKMIGTKNAHQWLYDLMVEHRDLFGYFENYNTMIEEIEIIINAAIRKEDYHITGILTRWLNELK